MQGRLQVSVCDFKEQADAALRDFALHARAMRANGRQWKALLRTAWATGAYWRHGCDPDLAATLQAVRNHPSYGLAYLNKFKL